MALRYHPVTEEVTPPIAPPRAQAMEENIVPETPSPVQKPGRSRGRGTWRTQQKVAVARGPRLNDDPSNQTQSLQHHAPHQDWHVGPVGFPPTMGRGDASPR